MKVWVPLMILICSLASAPADVAVLTQHNNLSRTGANLQETILNTSNVNSNQFGLLFTRAVDDQIYAQPLVMTNVDIPGKGVHNIVIVATVNDSVYAFDADDPSVVAPYWQVSFTNANVVAPQNTDFTQTPCGTYNDFSGHMGIVSTPVIDPATWTIYLLARTKESGTNFVQKLHALDIRTGAEQTYSPVTISATYPGTGEDSVSNTLTFNPMAENQRSALTLVNDVVYIGWASECDWEPYHGWLIGYDAATLQQAVVYNTTPNGHEGGIWMAGQGLSADTNGNLFVSVANGTVGNDSNGDRRDIIGRGESFLKLTRNGTNLVVDTWFTPADYQTLENNDWDLGSAGMLLIPNTTLAFSGGKEGVLYLVDRDDMGGLSWANTDTNIVQSFNPEPLNRHQILGAPIWWDGPNGSYTYIWISGSDYLRQYKFDWNAGQFQLPAFAISTMAATNGTPGGILSLSANGTNAGTGIVWASHQLGGSANQTTRPGILRAFNAENVTNELWDSEQVSSRDSVGNFAKFVPPTVANGKVYLATFSNRLNIYGLFTININLSGGNVILTWSTNSSQNYGLQSTTNLLNGPWSDITNGATVTNGLYQLTAPITNRAMFYRLKSN
jgi:hypothetical protein